jgi:hypothetical protein
MPGKLVGKLSAMTWDNAAADDLEKRRHISRHVAWILWATFLITFLLARITVLLIMMHLVRTMYLRMGNDRTHVHHLNYGIFLLSFVGGFLVLVRPIGKKLTFATIIYGIGLALTFDEFGMWLHLGGAYWQRASFDAVIVIAALLSLIVAAPTLKRMRPHHYITGALLLVMLVVFAVFSVRSLQSVTNKYSPFFLRVESSGPEE